MKYQGVFIVILMLLVGCNPDKNRVVDRNNPVFKTTDATKLFFKNVRTLYYDIEERNDGKIQILRLKSRVEDSSRAIINVDIVNNWFQDRAYPMVVLSSYFDSLEDFELVISASDGFEETLGFNRQSSMDSHFYFASAIYEGILKGRDFRLANSGLKLFTESEEREAFRTTMVDFYRLVAIY